MPQNLFVNVVGDMITPRWAVAALAGFLCVAGLFAEEWPGWRGPRGDGTSEETGLPVRWSSTENVRWKTPMPGVGHSSPVVWGDRVFVTTCVTDEGKRGGKRELLCLDRHGGKVLWERVVLTARLEAKHPLNSHASSTPATDGEHVWVTFLDDPDMVVACYTQDGREVWRRSPGKLLSRHGFCTSPVLHKDLVILNGDQDGDGYLVALDRHTGEERWRTARPNHTRSYCTPLLVRSPGRPGVTQLVLSGSRCVAGYDADTGKGLWVLDGPTEQFVASLVYGDGLLFLTAGYPEFHLMGLRPDGAGNVTHSALVAWHLDHRANRGGKLASYVPSPLTHGGHFFVVSDVGYLSCLEARTGKRLWAERLGRHHSASPALAGGHLYLPDDDGVTWVVKAGGKFELVAKNPLGEECYASPAVAHGHLFLRTLHHLWCIGPEAK
jgi:outer membrane protein assembly factor BamB